MAFSTVGTHVLLAALVFGIYLRTLFPSVPGGDSGELMAEACQLGVAHPPGYPLFVLVAHAAVAWFPWGSPAFRINLLSAAADTAAAVLIGHTVIMLARARVKGAVAHVAGFTAGALFALSPLIWLYAVGAEVFSVNNMFSALVVWQTVRIAQRRTHWDVCVGAFLCGLAACNQHTIVLFEVPLILYILVSHRRGLTASRIAAYATCYIAGMLPYIYVPAMDTFAKKRGSWGDSSTLAGFVRHFLRKDYGTFRLYAKDTTGPRTLERIQRYASNMTWVQLPSGVALLVVVGLVASVVCKYATSTKGKPAAGAKDAPASQGSKTTPANTGAANAASTPELVPAADTSGIARGLVMTYVFYLVVFHFLANMPLDDPLLYGVHARFWQQPHVLACVFLGLGIVEAARAATNVGARRERAGASTSTRRPPMVKTRKRGAKAAEKAAGTAAAAAVAVAEPPASIVAVCTAVCVAVVAWQAQRSFHVSDHSHNRYLDTYMRAILEPLPQGAVFISGYDQQWTVGRYLQTCEGLRPDLHILNGPVASYAWFQAQRHLYPELTFPGTHLVGSGTQKHKDGGFTLNEFLLANIDEHDIFTAGRPVFSSDDDHLQNFDEVPYGLVRQMVRKGRMDAAGQRQVAMEAWEQVERRMAGDLPDPTKFDLETWESTTRIDFWSNAQSGAEFVLESALAHDSSIDFVGVMFAARVLEDVLRESPEDPNASFYKNLGLAYARFVQSRGRVPKGTRLSKIPGLPANPSVKAWKEAASLRVLDTWGKFLRMPDAKSDGAYASIAGIVQRLHAAAAKQPSK